jgi:Holliday junction resolvasome RuvABC endonuclease subunit
MQHHLEQVRPIAVFFEDTKYMHKYKDASAVYSKIMGVVEVYCERSGIPLCGITPASIRLTLANDGHLKKSEVPAVLARKYGISETNLDTADALAVAAHVVEKDLIASFWQVNSANL